MFRTGVIIRGRAYVKLAGSLYPLSVFALKQKEASRIGF